MQGCGQRAIAPTATQRDAEVDTLLFAIALRQLVRAVEFCQPHSASRIDRALNRFKAAVPAWLDLRDVVEHFDDYERGKGNLQESGRMGSLLEWFEYDGTTRRLVIPPHSLDIAAAMDAADSLAQECLDAALP